MKTILIFSHYCVVLSVKSWIWNSLYFINNTISISIRINILKVVSQFTISKIRITPVEIYIIVLIIIRITMIFYVYCWVNVSTTPATVNKVFARCIIFKWSPWVVSNRKVNFCTIKWCAKEILLNPVSVLILNWHLKCLLSPGSPVFTILILLVKCHCMSNHTHISIIDHILSSKTTPLIHVTPVINT